MLRPLRRERFGIADVRDLGARRVVDVLQQFGALGRQAVHVAAAAAAHAAGGRPGPHHETLLVERGQAALTGAPADRVVDHLMHLRGVHVAVGAQQAQHLGLAAGPRHSDDE